jgi:hypothetical protein
MIERNVARFSSYTQWNKVAFTIVNSLWHCTVSSFEDSETWFCLHSHSFNNYSLNTLFVPDNCGRLCGENRKQTITIAACLYQPDNLGDKMHIRCLKPNVNKPTWGIKETDHQQNHL